MARALLLVGLSFATSLFFQNSKSVEQRQSKKSSAPVSVGKTTTEKPSQEQTESADAQIVKVTIATSRPEVTTSGHFGLYADLQNLAPAPITLYPSETTLVIQTLVREFLCPFAEAGTRNAREIYDTCRLDSEHRKEACGKN
jgi:hypothetical protein